MTPRRRAAGGTLPDAAADAAGRYPADARPRRRRTTARAPAPRRGGSRRPIDGTSARDRPSNSRRKTCRSTRARHRVEAIEGRDCEVEDSPFAAPGHPRRHLHPAGRRSSRASPRPPMPIRQHDGESGGPFRNDAAPQRRLGLGSAIRRRSTPLASTARRSVRRRGRRRLGRRRRHAQSRPRQRIPAIAIADLRYARPNRPRLRSIIVGATSRTAAPDARRQPRSREGRRQGALRADRRHRPAIATATPNSKAAARCRRRTATRRWLHAGTARRLRDLARHHALRRDRDRPPPLRPGRSTAPATRRSSTGLAARGGVALDLGEKLTGEISAGWVREDFDDDRLEPISTAVARRRTRLVADARHDRQPVRLDDGRRHHDARRKRLGALFRHVWRSSARCAPNLTGNAICGAACRDYSGSDGHDLIAQRRGRR